MLRTALAAYNGRNIGPLEEILSEVPPSRRLLAELIDVATDDSNPTMQIGATWLLRKYLERGQSLDAALCRTLAGGLERIETRWARLHLCQTLASIAVPADCLDAFASFCRRGIASEHPFLRAWAHDAFHRLARQHPTLAPEAAVLLDAAEQDRAPSVRARVRAIRRERGTQRG